MLKTTVSFVAIPTPRAPFVVLKPLNVPTTEKISPKNPALISPCAISLGLVKNFISTSDLLRKTSESIFKLLLQNEPHRETFYFRAPEDEFRVST